jgi:hypothetical protein
MASEKIPMQAGIDPVSLIGMFTGSKGGGKTTTGTKGTTTTTTKGNISEEGINSMIQKILSSDSGIAAIAQGEKRTGLYNSTTNQMLVNDLITRAAGELAERQAGTTTTVTRDDTVTEETSKSRDPQLDPLKTAGLLGLYAIGQKAGLGDLIGGVYNKIPNIGGDLVKLIFGDGAPPVTGEGKYDISSEIENLLARYPNAGSAMDIFQGFDWNNLPPDMLDPGYGE